jgi:hypothetical protein
LLSVSTFGLVLMGIGSVRPLVCSRRRFRFASGETLFQGADIGFELRNFLFEQAFACLGSVKARLPIAGPRAQFENFAQQRATTARQRRQRRRRWDHSVADNSIRSLWREKASDLLEREDRFIGLLRVCAEGWTWG